MIDKDEVDPLDAFMESLNDLNNENKSKTKNKKSKFRKKSSSRINSHEIRTKLSTKSIQDILHEGLSTNLIESKGSSINKGLKFMQKMGFKTGSGLGKKSNGITDPVGIYLHSGLSGIGVKRKKEELKARVEVTRKINQDSRDHQIKQRKVDFRSNVRSKFKQRKLISDLKQAKNVCETLDVRNNIMKNPLWYTEEEDATTTTTTSATSEIVDNDRIIDESTRGIQSVSVIGNDPDLKTMSNNPEEVEHDDIEALEIKILEVLVYLREIYVYCYHCGASYQDNNDLLANCPGINEDCH